MDLIFILSPLQQIFNQQVFIDGTGYLCYKDAVIAVNIGLCTAGLERMHRMAAFMSQGEYAVKVFLVVHQDIGISAINSGRVGAGSLTFVFIDINPA